MRQFTGIERGTKPNKIELNYVARRLEIPLHSTECQFDFELSNERKENCNHAFRIRCFGAIKTASLMNAKLHVCMASMFLLYFVISKNSASHGMDANKKDLQKERMRYGWRLNVKFNFRGREIDSNSREIWVIEHSRGNALCTAKLPIRTGESAICRDISTTSFIDEFRTTKSRSPHRYQSCTHVELRCG